MAAEERTEQATPKKRQESREKGQVAKSMEVNAAVGLLAGLMALRALGPGLVENWRALATDHMQRAGNFEMTFASLQSEALIAGKGFLLLVLPLLTISLLAGLVANIAQVGFLFATKTLTPDFGRLNPLEGLKRMFSARSAMELLKAAFKALLIGYMIYTFLRDRGPEIVRLIQVEPGLLGASIADLCYALLMKATLIIVVIAVADYIFQRWQFEKSIRMTKQEVKEEYKRLEGDPLIKGRARQLAREMSRKRMMADVPSATVVITNPTHFAVALRYEAGMAAPKVVAKGQRLVAQRIRELAQLHEVPIVENKPVARALFEQCDIGGIIPGDLYQAVAEIIAFVYKQSGRTPGMAGR